MKSLAGRMFVILLLATVAIQVLSFGGVLVAAGTDYRRQMYEFMAADLDFVHRFLRTQPPAQRGDWLARLNRGYYELLLQPIGEQNPSLVRSQLDATALPIQRKVGPQVTVRPILIAALNVPGLEIPIDGVHKLVVSFEGRDPPLSPPPLGVILGYLAAVMLGVMLVAWLAVRLATRPLSQLAAAARTLGANLNAPQVAETGPTEVAGAARAFNAMQRAIQKHLDERTQILTSISHDLKTPLTRLRLRAADIAPAEQRTRFEADIDAMAALVQEGLDYAQSAQLREVRVPLDINRLIEDIAERGGDMDHRVSIAGALADPYDCAPRAIERAIQNLVDNAVKYGGSAHISVHEQPDSIEIRVEDDGPGLPDDLLQKMFDPFVRGENSRNRETGGTGLGLSIARNLVRGHGGEIRLENRPQGGLAAHVTLPRGSRPAAA